MFPIHRRLAALVIPLLLVSSVWATGAEEMDPAVPRNDLDARIRQALYEATDAGVSLYNEQKDPRGCYRVWQGALLAVAPLLDHRPEVKAAVLKGIRDAEGQATWEAKAYALRAVLDDTRRALRPAPAPVPMPPAAAKSLWERIGGEVVVKAVVHDFVEASAKDPAVNFDRKGAVKLTPDSVVKLERLIVELVSQVTGGPLKYTGRDMKTAHKGMGITDQEFDVLISHYVNALKKHKVGQKEIDELLVIAESVRKDIVESKKPEPPAPTLWSNLGGEEVVTAVVHDFVESAAKDPKVDFSRGGKHVLDAKAIAHLEKQLVDLISTHAAGPHRYTGKDMKTVHAGMKISDEQFDALAGHLSAALKKHKVAQKDIDLLLGIVAGTRKDIVEK